MTVEQLWSRSILYKLLAIIISYRKRKKTHNTVNLNRKFVTGPSLPAKLSSVTETTKDCWISLELQLAPTQSDDTLINLSRAWLSFRWFQFSIGWVRSWGFLICCCSSRLISMIRSRGFLICISSSSRLMWFLELNQDHGHVVTSLTTRNRWCQTPIKYSFTYHRKLAFMHN